MHLGGWHHELSGQLSHIQHEHSIHWEESGTPPAAHFPISCIILAIRKGSNKTTAANIKAASAINQGAGPLPTCALLGRPGRGHSRHLGRPLR